MLLVIIRLARCVTNINTSMVPIYCKSYSLPKEEISEGTEHAIKARNERNVYNFLRDKFITVNNFASKAQDNLVEQFFVHVLLLIISGQSIIKGINNMHNQQDDSNAPKININYQKSTTRLPKGSNSYGDGGLILGTRS